MRRVMTLQCHNVTVFVGKKRVDRIGMAAWLLTEQSKMP